MSTLPLIGPDVLLDEEVVGNVLGISVVVVVVVVVANDSVFVVSLRGEKDPKLDDVVPLTTAQGLVALLPSIKDMKGFCTGLGVENGFNDLGVFVSVIIGCTDFTMSNGFILLYA